MNDSGFIKLSRKFFDNKIWQAARAFSECEAWLDLIQSARFEASPTTSRIGCYEVTWGMGQYPASNRFLAKKWGRSEQWIKTFLGKLKREKMITTDNAQGVNVITLVNFEKYNGIAVETPPANPLGIPPNIFNNNDLCEVVTHLVTQQVTHFLKKQPTSNPNNKKDKENIKKPPKGGKESQKGSGPELIQWENELKAKEAELNAKEHELLQREVALKAKAAANLPDISFASDAFRDIFSSWLEYKRERKESYKSQKSLEACYKKLLRLSGNNPDAAKLIVEQSMASNYAGLFELKNPIPDRYKQENETLLESVKDAEIGYYKFLKYLKDYAPYCFANMKMPTQKEIGIIQKIQKDAGNEHMCKDALAVIEGKPTIREKWDNLYLAIIHQFKYKNGS